MHEWPVQASPAVSQQSLSSLSAVYQQSISARWTSLPELHLHPLEVPTYVLGRRGYMGRGVQVLRQVLGRYGI